MIKVTALILLLTGCTVTDAYKFAAVNLGGKIAAQALVDAEFVICKATPVGAVEARYNTAELVAARREICDRPVEPLLVNPR